MPEGLQYSDIVAAQQGNTRDQQAAIDQALVQPAPTQNPTPASSLSEYYPKGSNSATATSGAYRGAINQVGQAITSEQNANPAMSGASLMPPPAEPDNSQLTSDYNASTQNVANERAALAAERDAQVSNINSSFDSEETTLKQTQASDEAHTGMTLARIGGYLGPGTAAEGAMQKLQQTHQNQINALEAKRQAAINQAINAYNQKDFQMANELVKEAKDYHSQILATVKQHATDVYNYNKEVNAQRAQDLKEAQAQEKENQANVTYARKAGVDKPFYSIDGTTLISTQTGQALHNMDEYTKMGGKGDGSDITYISSLPTKFETKNIMAPDGTTHSVHVGYNSQGQVVSQTDLGVSKLKAKAKGGGGGGGSHPTNTEGYDPKQLAAVQKIIKANPGEYGKAADQIDAKFGKGTATQYDSVLRSHYNINDNAKAMSDVWNAHPNEQNVQNYNALKEMYLKQHQFDTAAATKAFNSLIKKPKK